MFPLKNKKKKRNAQLKDRDEGWQWIQVWKYNKSQIWIIGPLQLFHISGVYIRVVSCEVFSNSWITVLILTLTQLWGQRKASEKGVNPWAPVLALQPQSSPRELWEQVEYHPQVWGRSLLSLLHPNTQILPEPPPFLDSSRTEYLTTSSSLCVLWDYSGDVPAWPSEIAGTRPHRSTTPKLAQSP